MRGPARQAVLALLRQAEERGSCCVAQTPVQARQLSRAVACGIALRPCEGLYVSKEHWTSLSAQERNDLMVRGLSQLHGTYVFAGPTAARLHGLSVSNRYLSDIWVTTTRKSHSSSQRRGPHRIQRIRVTGDRPVRRKGITVSSFMRTIYDCLRLMDFPDALAVADSALRIKGISRKRLAANVQQSCARRRDLSKVLDIIALADGRSENGGESIARARMISLGFAIPDLQRILIDPLDATRFYRVDFAWDLDDETLVVGELDGRQKYIDQEMTHGRTTDEVLLAERRREAHLTLAGRRVLVMRFSLAETEDDRQFSKLLDSYGIPRVSPVTRNNRPLPTGYAA